MKKLILSIKNLTVKFKDDKKVILDNVSLDLFEGDVLAIDGLNGSGKTTLLNLIAGKTDKYIIESGEIIYPSYSKESIFKFSRNEMLQYLSKIGYVTQKDSYDGLNALTVSDLIDDAILDSNITKKEAVDLFNEYFYLPLNIKLNSKPARMSGGEKRMISIFLGLILRKNMKLMIVDEPLNNLDFENATKISDMLNEIHLNNKESAIILVTHCKIITCINRQRRIKKGKLEEFDSIYEYHHCMGEPDCNLFYCNKNEKICEKADIVESRERILAQYRQQYDNGVFEKLKKAHEINPFKVSNQTGKQSLVCFVFSCPGNKELITGKVCQGRTGENLNSLLSILVKKNPEIFKSDNKDDYDILNATQVVHFEALDKKSEGTKDELKENEEIIEKYLGENKNLKYVVLFGEKASKNKSLFESKCVATTRHLSDQSINSMKEDNNDASSKHKNKDNKPEKINRKLEKIADEILNQFTKK